MEIFEKVKEITVDQLGVSEDAVTMEAFDIEIPDEDAEKITAVKDAVEYIKEHQD